MKQHKLALVTGGAIRIGSAIVDILAANQFDIVLHYNESYDDAMLMKNRVENLHGRQCSIIQGDLCKDWQKTLESIFLQKSDFFTLLVNNASIYKPTHFFDTTPDYLDQNIGIHIKSTFFLMQKFVADLPENSTGYIINMLDSNLHECEKFFPYALTKNSLVFMTEHLSKTLKQKVIIKGISLGKTLNRSKHPVPPDIHGLREVIQKIINMKQQDEDHDLIYYI